MRAIFIFSVVCICWFFSVDRRFSFFSTQAKPPDRSKKSDDPPPFKIRPFKDAAAALGVLIKQHSPRVVGFGEYHQLLHKRHIRPSIQRFTKELLPMLSGYTDLLVETWMIEGRCGREEKKVVAQVKRTIQRPVQTEDHILSLLKSAKHRKIQPHILHVSCKDYQSLLDPKGQLRKIKLLHFVTHLLGRRIRVILTVRWRRFKQKGRVIVYGGALHNDLHPAPTLGRFAYAPALARDLTKHPALSGSYLEIDLYVPEYIEEDDEIRKEPWFKHVLQTRTTKQALLISRSPRSHIIVYPWSPKSPPRDATPKSPPHDATPK